MRSQAKARFFFALALSSVGAACTYDPHPKDGQEQCSSKDRLCPWGYDCADNNLCYSWGHLPANPGAGGTISSTGGRSAAGGNSGAGGTHSATVIGAAGVITAGGVTHAGGVISVGGLIVAGGGAGIPDSGGGLSTGGTVGTGGATDCTPSKASGLTPVIDNMADGDTGIIAQDGRMGGWYTYGDGTGTSSLDSSKPGMMCASGSGFSTWGAGLGVSFNAVPTKTCTYDASIYSGIRFTIAGAITNGMLRVSVQTADIASGTSAGGTCVSTSVSRDDCNDIYGADLFLGTTGGTSCQSTVSSWICGPATGAVGAVTVTVPFSYMSQQGWGRAFPTFNPKVMLGLQWQFKTCAEIGCYTLPTSFDICVGDLSFY
jgi:hypothetical protein